MKKNLLNSFRLKFFRFLLYIKKEMKTKETISEEEIRAVSIIKNLSLKGESELLFAPISQKIYIKNKDIFIVFENGRVNIINGVYYYDINLSITNTSELKGFLNRIIENRRNKMEMNIKSKVLKSLDTIIEQVKS